MDTAANQSVPSSFSSSLITGTPERNSGKLTDEMMKQVKTALSRRDVQ